jgi:hypothetical protein
MSVPFPRTLSVRSIIFEPFVTENPVTSAMATRNAWVSLPVGMWPTVPSIVFQELPVAEAEAVLLGYP